MNVGLTETQLKQFAGVLSERFERQAGERALQALQRQLADNQRKR